MYRTIPLLLLLLSALTGCVEAEEKWVFDESGGGTYELSLAWDADLWRRVEGILGTRAMGRFAVPGFPLRKAEWADGLGGLKDVDVLKLEEALEEGGLRRVSVQVRFKKLEELLRWEVLARRTVKVTQPPVASPKDGPKKDAICKFYMEPIARVAVLDRVGALLDAVERPPPKAEGAAAARDGGPLDRFGLDEMAAKMVWKMVKPSLARVRLRTTVEVPGVVQTENETLALKKGSSVVRSWDFEALRKMRTDRTVRFSWRLRSRDVAPLAVQVGDKDLRPNGPTGRKP